MTIQEDKSILIIQDREAYEEYLMLALVENTRRPQTEYERGVYDGLSHALLGLAAWQELFPGRNKK